MIPVLAVPALHPDRVEKMLASVDVPCVRRLVIDNGGKVPDLPNVHVVRLPHNLGVAASWNLAMKLTPHAPWWAIVNDDVEFGGGDLAALCAEMENPTARVVTMDGFAAFGINRAALDTVGWFDENYHPAYVEDADYERRCRLAGVPIIPIRNPAHHTRSATIADPHYGRQNGRTYPLNVAYHRAKWGGGVRSGEVYVTPFDAGGPVYGWNLDSARLRQQGWEREP
jgi:GT2 family glycosyltransferase